MSESVTNLGDCAELHDVAIVVDGIARFDGGEVDGARRAFSFLHREAVHDEDEGDHGGEYIGGEEGVVAVFVQQQSHHLGVIPLLQFLTNVRNEFSFFSNVFCFVVSLGDLLNFALRVAV